MTAHEMFEKLGYKHKDDRLYISYEYDEEHYFIFHKNVKQISIGNYHITFDELKAINQQSKELGWQDVE